jgi:hypothetical protein
MLLIAAACRLTRSQDHSISSRGDDPCFAAVSWLWWSAADMNCKVVGRDDESFLLATTTNLTTKEDEAHSIRISDDSYFAFTVILRGKSESSLICNPNRLRSHKITASTSDN